MFRKSGFTLAEDATHVDICNNTRRTAFTLAEVLITLAIIGVVAAMTIPTLISDYQEKVTVTKVKKMYSTLSNAYQLYVANDGTPQYMDWTEEGASKVYNVFAPYLKIAKDCGTNDQNCISYSVRRLKDGTDDPAIRKNEYDVVLNDGSSISFRGHSDSRYLGVIYYDINTNLAPNQWGYDIFQFMILPERIVPSGEPNDTIIDGDLGFLDRFETGCAESTARGYACTAWVIHKGNLDYLKCDNLTWSDNKCK